MFNKHVAYPLSLSKNYVSHWGLIEAMREIIQNAIDSDSPFEYSVRVSELNPDHMDINIVSKFAKLSPQSLLLGSTSKAGDKDAIGSFGEGYKLALLVLTRIGKHVKVFNGDKIWLTGFETSDLFNSEILTIYERHNKHPNVGLTFSVHGLTLEELKDVQSVCLHMQDYADEQVLNVRYGAIMVDRPGMLYVGGLFICKTDMKFGYDIKPEFMKLERDRQTVDTFDLHMMTKNMWFDTGDFERVAAMIDEGITDLEYAEYGAPEIVKNACYKLFQKKHPGAIAARNQDELNQLVMQGMENIVIVNSNMHTNLYSSRDYKSVPHKPVETIEHRMTRWLSSHRNYMRKDAIVGFKELIEESKSWIRR
jgi:hypothetical protein